MKLLFMFLNLILLVDFGSSSEQNITAIQSSACSDYNPGANASVITDKTMVESLSLCLRVKFQSWAQSVYLVQSENLYFYLLPYENSNGMFSYNTEHNYIQAEFNWKNTLFPTNFSWNSICISYHGLAEEIIIAINGEKVVVTNYNFFNASAKLYVPYFLLGTTYSYHQELSIIITDFNVWSRALTIKQILQFTSAEDTNFVAESKPDMFIWTHKNANIQLDNCTKFITINVKSVFPTNRISKRHILLFTTHTPTLDEAHKQCKRFNGELSYPRNVDHLNSAFVNGNQNDFISACPRIWVPLQRSEENLTKWFHYGKRGIKSEISFEPWGKVEIEEKGNCIYFNLQKKSYHETKCGDYYCGMCEIEQKRLVFRINSECDDLWKQLGITSYYFLSQFNPYGFNFAGANGETKFILNGTWSLQHVFYNLTKTTLAELDMYGYYNSMGLNKWSVKHCGEKKTALIKINNVSINFLFVDSISIIV
jgi:hypothetical protein